MSIPETTVSVQVVQVRVVAMKAEDTFKDERKGGRGGISTLPLKTALWEMEQFRT